MKETNLTFSICIPNYNYGKYIGDTIQSVLNQTYQHFEIIVVDNASTDNSVAVVKSFKDPRIKLFQNNYNIGFSPNLQKATSYASNNYLNLLSSDDQMKPNALEIYADIIFKNSNEDDLLIVMSDFEGFNDQNNIEYFSIKNSNSFTRNRYVNNTETDTTPFKIYEGIEVLKDGLSRLGTVGGFCTTIYSKKLWQNIEGYNSVRTIGPDKHFIFKALTQNPKVIYINKVLFRYRDQQSETRTAISTNVRFHIDQYLNVLEFGTEEISNISGISHLDLTKIFVNKDCINQALSLLSYRQYSLAFKIFAFVLSTYPKVAFKNPKTYILLMLLIMGPFSVILALPAKFIFNFAKTLFK